VCSPIQPGTSSASSVRIDANSGVEVRREPGRRSATRTHTPSIDSTRPPGTGPNSASRYSSSRSPSSSCSTARDANALRPRSPARLSLVGERANGGESPLRSSCAGGVPRLVHRERLDARDRRDSVDGLVERRDGADAGALAWATRYASAKSTGSSSQNSTARSSMAGSMVTMESMATRDRMASAICGRGAF
jgi:hypothetical protein